MQNKENLTPDEALEAAENTAPQASAEDAAAVELNGDEIEQVLAEDAQASEEQPETDDKKKKHGAKKSSKNGKLKNKNAMKRSTFMLIMTLVLLVALVLANVLSAVVAQRLPTTIDTTADASNTLTEANIKFIKSLENDVEVIVCATREGYTGSEMCSYAADSYYVQENNAPYNYFNQTITLVEAYPKYNSHVKVRFVDMQSPDSQTLKSELNTTFNYGDIIVRCTRTVDGKQNTQTSVIGFEDIYEMEDPSGNSGYSAYGMSTYVITASNIESELSGAIYTVAASEKRNLAVLTGHSEDTVADTLTDMLNNYNFEVTEIKGTVNSSVLKDVDTVLMASPVSDLSGEELKALDSFLDNDGKRGKSFLVYGSLSAPATPNLDQFMEEWGIIVTDKLAYETNSNYKDGTAIMLFNKEDDLTKSANDSKLQFAAADNIALERGYETSGSRTTHILLATSETAVYAPKTAGAGFTPPSDSKKQEIPTAMLTEDTLNDENYNELSSYVGYFSSADFISKAWLQYSAIGNMDFAVTTVNSISGRDSSSMYFIPKITGVTSMTLTDSQKSVVMWAVMIILPILVLLGGISVWIWRRNR